MPKPNPKIILTNYSRITCILFFLLIYFPNYSQDLIDSILTRVEGTPQSQKKAYLDSLIYYITNEYISEADTLFKMAIDHSNNLDQRILAEARYAHYLGKMYKVDKATNQFNQIFKDTSTISDPKILGDVFFYYAINREDVRENEQARIYLLQAVEQYQVTGDTTYKNYPDCWMELGWVSSILGLYGESSVASNTAKQMYLSNRDSAGVSASYINLTILYSQIGLYDEARQYVEESKKYLSDPQNKFSVFQEKVNEGRNLILQDRWQEAYLEYNIAIDVMPLAADDKFAELFALNGLIETLYFLNKKDSISYYFKILEKTYRDLSQSERYAQLYLQSKFFDRLSSKSYNASEIIGQDLMATALKSQDASEVMTHARFLAELYKNWRRFDQALLYNEIYVNTKDSIQNANKAHALLLYQTQFETAEKEFQIQSLEQEKTLLNTKSERDRLYRILLVASLLTMGLFGFAIYNRQRVKNLERTQALRQEISANLHDEVGSLLSGISMQAQTLEYIPKNEVPSIVKDIGNNTRQAVSTMRDLVWSIDSRRDKVVDLKDKIAETCHRVLANSKFTYSIEFDEHSDVMKTINPKMKQELLLIFKEALNNILKHSNGDKIAVRLLLKNKFLHLEINDNGTHRDSQSHTGQGIDNMKYRAQEINGQLRINQTEKSFSVEAKVPI